MDDKPSLLQRVHTLIVYLGAGLLLVNGSRTLLSRLQIRLWPQKAGEKPGQAANHASVAFLVDGENLTSHQVERLMERALDEAKKLGEMNIKRVYGSCNLFNSKWNDICLHLELEQIHLAKPTANKNTADIALAVDAIELAVNGTCNRFCIVTSDSDFTPLVRRLRELKCQVLGIGERKTPNTLTKVCNWFVYTDQLIGPASTSPSQRTPTTPHSTHSTTPDHSSNEPSNGNQAAARLQQPDAAPGAQPKENLSPTVITVLTEAYRDAVHGRMGEWVLLSRLGLSLRQLYPDFKAIDYAGDLSDLIKKYYTVFEFGKRANGHPQMRLKQ